MTSLTSLQGCWLQGLNAWSGCAGWAWLSALQSSGLDYSSQGSSGMMDHRLMLILQTASTLISVLRKKNRKRNTHTFRTT